MTITYYGHACFLVEIQGKKLLFDPFISGNPLASDVDMNRIEADYILLTHGHMDHVLDAEQIAKKTGALIISNFEIVQWYIQKGLKGHHMNHGGKYTFDFGTVKFVSAIHSSVLPDGTYGGNAGGFVIWNDDCCFYVAGDTALTYDMKLIPQLCPQLTLAILPLETILLWEWKKPLWLLNLLNVSTSSVVITTPSLPSLLIQRQR